MCKFSAAKQGKRSFSPLTNIYRAPTTWQDGVPRMQWRASQSPVMWSFNQIGNDAKRHVECYELSFIFSVNFNIQIKIAI